MPIMHPVDELLTTADAARIAGVVPDTFRLWQRLGRVSEAFRTPTGIRLYRRVDVERMAYERSIRNGADVSA
jgi:DNA-binding transcriptional MerR regulator